MNMVLCLLSVSILIILQTSQSEFKEIDVHHCPLDSYLTVTFDGTQKKTELIG